MAKASKRPGRALFISLLAAGASWANRDGAQPRKTGGAFPAESVCTECHSGPFGSRPNAGPGSITFSVQPYRIGETQRVTMVVADPGASQIRWGFSLTARPQNAPATQAGNFRAVDANTQVVCDNDLPAPCPSPAMLQFPTHTRNGTRRGTRSPVTFDIEWTAPAANVGPIVFAAAGNAANGNDLESGDNVYTRSITVEPAAGQSPPVPPPVPSLPTVSSVVNLASGTNLLAPGTLAAIFGSNLALQQPSTVPLSVLVNGLLGAIVMSTPDQLVAQLPVEARAGPAVLQFTRLGFGSAPFPIILETHAPGIFTSAGNLGSVLRLDGRMVTLASPAQPGEGLSVAATGLGPTNPGVSTGVSGPANPRSVTLTMPLVTVGGQRASVQEAFLEPGAVGRYRVLFSVPGNLSGGNHPLWLEIGGKISNTVILPVIGQGLPAINSVVNAGSFASTGVAAAGSILTIFGVNFGQRDNLAAFPVTAFEGLTVSFNTVRAPLFAVVPSANQINVLAPTDLPEFGRVAVQVTTAAGRSSDFSLQMVPAAPGIFRIPDPSGVVKNNAAALLANTAWLAMPESLGRALRIPQNCASAGISPASVCGQPAAPGDVLQLFATGLGRATPGGAPGGGPLPTGSVAPRGGEPLYMTIDLPVVSVGEVPAQVLFSGLAPGFAGLYQVNVRVPLGAPAGDEIPVRVSAPNGLGDTATIAIRR